MKTCKANGAPTGAFVEFNDRQMLVVDDDTIDRAIIKWCAGEIDGLCTTYVTDMSELFFDNEEFNQPIGDWDVSSVRGMEFMFCDAKSFNQSISDWDVSSVTDMACMFSNAISFNQNISIWNVPKMK